jgi:hypothetical protein
MICINVLTLRGKTWDADSYSYNTDPDPDSEARNVSFCKKMLGCIRFYLGTVPVSFLTVQTVLKCKAYVLLIRKESKNVKEAFSAISFDLLS